MADSAEFLMNEPSFLNTIRDRNESLKKIYIFCFATAVQRGELAGGGAVAVAVSVGDMGKVTYDM